MWRRLTVFVSLLVIAGMLAAPVAHADVNDFTINNMTADYTLGTADPQGTLKVDEQLSVQFTDYNHGILRALPKRYNGAPLHIHVVSIKRDGNSEAFSTYTSNGNEVLKIGNANYTITGLHHYDIHYTVSNVVTFHGGTPQLNWNVNGTEWQQPFESVVATLHLQAQMYASAAKTTCYTGSFGSKSSNCQVSHTAQDAVVATTQPLQAGETLTLNTPLPAGIFRQPTLLDKLGDYAAALLPLLGLPLVVTIVCSVWWYARGRDVRGRGTIIPEYSPPDGLKPAEIDVILHNKLGRNAISATIIDLAIRGYLKIQEGQSDGVLGIGKHKTYSFVLNQTPRSDQLKVYEAQVFNGIFDVASNPEIQKFRAQFGKLAFGKPKKLTDDVTAVVNDEASAAATAVGQSVDINSLKKTFYLTAKLVQKAVPKNLASAGYFTRDPSRAGSGGQVFGGILFFVAFYLFAVSLTLAVGMIISAIILFVFASIMPRRTAKGAAAKDAIEGLKLYLTTAEKDRIAMLQSPDAPYAPQSAEPVKTVELFEKLLPYAMVLGVEKQWAKQFEGIYTAPPDWYSGNWSTFNAVYLANSLGESMSAMNSSFAAPQTSGSGSGFSGGAGGGGGGGGGGGW